MDFVIPCNPKYYDIAGAFKELKRIEWHQTCKNISVGDTVYIYVAKPIASVKYKCKVTKSNKKTNDIDDARFNKREEAKSYDNFMTLKLEKKYKDNLITMKELSEYGDINFVLSQRSLPLGLIERIEGNIKTR